MKNLETQQHTSFGTYIYMYVCRAVGSCALWTRGRGLLFILSFFFCTFIPSSVEAQVAHVQDFGNVVAAGSPITASTSVSVTPGNSLVVFARQTSAAVRTYVVSDDIEGTSNWVQLISTTTGSYGVYMWYKQNAPPDITRVTVTHGQATGGFLMGVSEFTGFGSTVRVVATTSRTDGSTSRLIHHASVTGITASEEVISVVAGQTTSTFTEGEPGVGYTEVTSGYASNNGIFQHQVLSAASTTQEAWSIRNSIYDNISTSSAAQDLTPQEVTFSPDGTYMFVVGSTGGRIYQYTLSSPWDVSSASFTASTSVTAQEATPLGVFFSATGTRMWVVGSSADRVFQYDLSVAWDLSTRVYNNASTSVNAQESTPSAMSFSQSGMKMYILGNTGQQIYQYSLSAAFDLTTTATYDSIATSTSVHDTSPVGMAFHASGTKVYILGINNDRIHEYTLSTPWDVSTMAYTGAYYYIPQDNTGTSIFFRPNGLRFFVSGNTTDSILQHSVIAEAGIWRNTGSLRIAITGMAFLGGSSGTDKTISGTLYSDEGLTRDTATRTIGVAVGTSTQVYFTTSSTTGEWTAYVASTSIATGTPIVVWVDRSETTRATLFTKASTSGNITGLDLYQNRVVISHEGVSGTSTTIGDMAFYDTDNDRDIQYRGVASTTSAKASLTVLSNQELYIKSGKTFASEGNVRISANASTTSATDGNLHLPGTATYTAGGHTIIGGSFTASGTATYTDNQYTLVFNATTTGKSVSALLPTLGNVYFSGQNGTWAFATSATTSNFYIGNSATVTAPTLLTIQNDYVNGGGFIHNSGTVRMASTSSSAISGLMGTSSAFSTLSIERGGSVSVEPLLTSVVTTEGVSALHFAIDARDRILYAVAGTTVYRCALITNCDESSDFSGTTTDQGSTVLSIGIDSVNRVLYMTEINGGGLIIRCALSTNCDASADFTTAYDSADSGLISLTVHASSTGGILFAGSYSSGIVYRCHLSTNCDAQGDFTTAYDTSEFDITAMTTYATSTGGVLYVGSYPGGIIYRCHLSTDCNAAGDFTTAYDTTSGQINSFAVDTVDGVLFVGSDSGDLYRCSFSTDCNASGDFATVADYFGSADSLDIDTTARTLYLTDGVSIYRCYLSTNCDVQAEFATSTGYTQALSLGNLIVDQVYDVVYFDNGDLQRCAFCMISDGTSMSVANLTIQNGASFAQAIETRISGDYTNNGTSTVNDVTPSMVFTGASAQSISGTLIATSSLGSVLFTGAGTKTFNNNASTTNMAIASGATVVAPTSLTISGTYMNNGTFSHNSGTVDMQSYIVEYLAGRSYTGASTSTASGYAVLDLIASGNYLYVGGTGDATACSQTVGSATGCELKVYDISSPSNPVYVAGRDSSGNASGSTANTILSLAISGNYLYVGERDALGNPACSQTAGSAEGCELKVYDISSPSNPVYVAGRDSTGDSSGIGFSYGLLSLTVSGNYLYVGKDADGGVACSQTAGSADGCVLQIYDISSSTNPIYVAGRDAYGSGNMQVYDGIASMVISGNYLYVGKGFDVTACSQTAGSAIGCELQVYNISSPTNPLYVAGRDASGDASGTGTVSATEVSILGNTLYVAKEGNATACSQTAGSADGCELMVFNISSSTNPVYVAGRDSSGAASGVGTEAIHVLTTYGKALYVGKNTDWESCLSTRSFATGCEITVFDISSTTNPLVKFNNDVSDLTNGDALFTRAFTFSGRSLYVGSVANSVSSCSQTPVSAGGCVLKVFRVGNPLSGTMTGSSAFNHLTVSGVGSAINANASTTDLTVATNSVLTAPAQLTVGGNYSNNGTFIHNGGTLDVQAYIKNYIAGVDSNASPTTTGALQVNTIKISGNYAYVGKDGNGTACSQVLGSAIGCELMVFDISDAKNPRYVAGRDGFGSATSTGSQDILDLEIEGNYLYVSRQSVSASNCTQVAGTAQSCGLQVYDISSSTNPIYVAGRDADGSSTGVGTIVSFYDLIISDGYLYGVKSANATACSQSAGSAIGCELMVFDVSDPTNPTYVAGRDNNGTATGTNNLYEGYTVAKSGNTLYTGWYRDSTTACQQSLPATGCEIKIFDVSDPTNPTYVGGLDSTASSGGSGGQLISDLSVSGNYLYAGKETGAGTCSQTAGSASPCEILVFDISSTTNPIYVAGRDADGASAGTASLGVNDIEIAHGFMYVGKSASATACSQTAGSATGCEYMVFDISSSTNPVYVQGLDTGGSESGTDSLAVNTVAVSKSVAIVGKSTSATACSQTAGSAIGCELMILRGSLLSGSMTGSSTLNDFQVTKGVAEFGSVASTTDITLASSSVLVAPTQLTLSGNYSSKGIFVHNGGTTTFSSTTAQTITNTMANTLSFGTLVLSGTSTKTFTGNASTTNFTIQNGATAVLPALFAMAGNYVNNGTTTAGTGTTTLNGTTTQSLSGNMIGTSAFNNLAITNISASGSSSQSVRFLSVASTTDTFTMYASTSAQFLAGATSTFQHVSLSGASGQKVYLRSGTPGTQYGFYVPGTQKTVSYVDVRDSSGCPAVILATDGTNVNSGNNTCWTFAAAYATIVSDAHQLFAYLQATTTMSPIVITEDAESVSITAANDIRLIIATSTTNMRWDTTDVTPTFAGTASGKVAGTVSYAGDGAILIIDVTSDFAPGDTLGVSDLSYARFETVSPVRSALGVRTSGAGTSTNNSDSKVVAITGTIAIGSHGNGQVDNAFTSRTVSVGELLAFRLIPGGESFEVANLVFPLKGTQGITTSELSSVYLYRDMNGDGAYDVGDVAVGGEGSVAINSQVGTITFSETFQSTTTQDYILIGSITELVPADAFVLAVGAEDLTSTGITSLIEVTESGGIGNLQHIRGGAGAGGGGNVIGGAPPAGDGIRTGGGGGGGGEIDPNSGNTIGNEVGFNAPTVEGGSWTNGTNAYSSNGVYATANSSVTHGYGSFGYNVPSNNQVTGIAVKIEASGSTAAGNISVFLSWDGGSTFTDAKITNTLGLTDAVFELGGQGDTWGRSWTPTEMNNGNLVVAITSNPSGNTVQVDAIQIKVFHQSTGGGGGGGGAVFKEPSRYFANVYSAVGGAWMRGVRSIFSWFDW